MPIPPSTNHYLAYRTMSTSKGPIVTSYRTKRAKEYFEWANNYLKQTVQNSGWEIDTTKRHIYVDTVFYFQHTHMDANNHFKVLLDAISESGLVWEDDSLVCERVQGVFYDRDNPRVELTIRFVDYHGVFPNAENYVQFTQNCATCRRDVNKCTILKDLVAGYHRQEVAANDNKLTCQSYKQKKEKKDNE